MNTDRRILMHRSLLHRTAATAGAVLGLAVMALVPSALLASSHREAPLISEDPTADNTDTYAFVSPDNPSTVTLIANYIPMEEPAGGPNFNRFSDDVLYTIHVDNKGDAQSDIEFQFTFNTSIRNPNTFLYNTGPILSLDDPNWNVRQFYNLTLVRQGSFSSVLGTNLPTPPCNIGPKSTPNYDNLANAAIQTLPNGIKVFCGPRDDPFFVDLGGLFDLLTIRVLPGNMGGGIDGLAGFNCHTIALQIPISLLTKDRKTPSGPSDPDAVIGVWATASRRQMTTLNNMGNPPQGSGPFVQISRLGMPLVNEVVIPLGKKDLWNNSYPSGDGQFLPYVETPELAGLLHALYGLNVPLTGRDDLVAVFLTGLQGLNQPPNVVPCEEMRLNVAIPPTDRHSQQFSRMGLLGGNLDGFPNGRRLEDDVTDIEVQAVAGVTYKLFHPDWNLDPLANQLGDGVDHNDVPFLDQFPYVASPHQGFADSHGLPEGPSAARSTPVNGLDKLGSPLAAPTALSKSEADVRMAQTASPNPFSGSTRIAYRVPTAGPVTVEVMDVMGREVRALVREDKAAGDYETVWDGVNAAGQQVASGTYFYRVDAGGQSIVRKMTLEK